MNDHEEFESHDDPTQTEAPRTVPAIFKALPFIILFFIGAAMLLLYVKHEYPTPKPKPLAAKVAAKDNTWQANQTSGGRAWIICNGGMEVTDARNCPDYKELAGWNEGMSLFHAGRYNAKPKHKSRRHWTWASSPRDQWTIINTVPSIVRCSKLSAKRYGQCESRPLTTAEIEIYKPNGSDEGVCPARTLDPKSRHD